MVNKKQSSPAQSELEMDGLSFEESLSELDQLVNQLESGELDLEDSLKKFERGIALARVSQHKLTAAQQRVEILLKQDEQSPLSTFDDADTLES